MKLSNGVEMPIIGFGTSEIGGDEEAANTVYSAVKAGYRLIDNASAYGNEVAVGKGIKNALRDFGLSRSDIFVTGKVANEARKGFDSTINEYNKTLEKIGLDCLDLYLIHWPVPRYMEDCYVELNRETWRAMESLYRQGKVRAIGVSNFLQRHVESMVEKSSVYPMVNQIEVNPFYQQRELIEYCVQNGIVVQGWGALGHGRVFKENVLCNIARKYNKSTAQLCLKWCLQIGALPIAKSSSQNHMKANMELFDFEISDEDMMEIAKLNSPDGHFDYYSYIRQMNY